MNILYYVPNLML